MTGYSDKFLHLSERCNLLETAEKQMSKYNNGLNFAIKDGMPLTLICTADVAQNIKLKVEILLSQSSAANRQVSTLSTPSASLEEKKFVRETTPGNQNISTSGMIKQGKQVPATTTYDHPYANPTVEKCFMCGEPDHYSNECVLINLSPDGNAWPLLCSRGGCRHG